MLFNWLFYAFFSAAYYPFVALPLTIIKGVVSVFRMIGVGLPQYLLFGIQPGDSFENVKLPLLFGRLAIVSVFVFAILFVISAIRVSFQKGDQPNPIRVAMKNSILATLWLLGLPLFLFLFSLFSGIIMDLLLDSSNLGISKQIFMSIRQPDSIISVEKWGNFADNGFAIPSDEYAYFYWGEGIKVIFFGAAISFATLIPLMLGILTLVQKIFQQFFLFIISPFIASAAIADDGKRMKQFQDMYAAKTFAILGLLISLQLFSAFVNRSIGWVNSISGLSFISRFIILFAVIVGGAISMGSITTEITAFVGESASVRETIGETKGLIKASMALGGAGWALGKAGAKLGGGSARLLTKKSPIAQNWFNYRDKQKMFKKDFKAGKITRSDLVDRKLEAWKDYKADKANIKQLKWNKKNEGLIYQQYQDALANNQITENDIPEVYRSENRELLDLNNRQLYKKEKKLLKDLNKNYNKKFESQLTEAEITKRAEIKKKLSDIDYFANRHIKPGSKWGKKIMKIDWKYNKPLNSDFNEAYKKIINKNKKD